MSWSNNNNNNNNNNNTNNINYKEIVERSSPNKIAKNCLATVDQYSVLVDTFPTVDRQTGGPNFGVHSADMKPRKC